MSNVWQYRHTVLALTTLAFATTMVSRLVISPLVPELTTTFDATTSDFGLALTGMWAAYALAQYGGGVLANRYGERLVILAALGSIAAASVLLAVAPNFPVFAVVALLLGCAAGLPYSATTSLLSKSFDAVGRAIGIYIAGGPIAGLLVPVVVTAVSAAFGWRIAVLVAASVAAPVFFAVMVGVRPQAPAATEGDGNGSSVGVREVLSRPEVRYTIVLAAGGAFAWQATASFLPTFLTDHHDYTVRFAGVLFGGYFLLHGLTQPVTGWLSDRFGRDLATVATMASAAVGFCLLVVVSSVGAIVVGLALVGLGMSWGAPVQSRFMDQFDDAERTVAFGLVRTVYMTIGSLGSVVVGVLSDQFGWTVAFGLLAILMVGEVVVLVANSVLGAD